MMMPKPTTATVVKTPFQEMMAEFSPDGRWLAYQSNETGQYEIYVQQFPEPGARDGGVAQHEALESREVFDLFQSGVGHGGVAEVEVRQRFHGLQMLQAPVGHFGFGEDEPFELGRIFEVGQPRVGDGRVRYR